MCSCSSITRRSARPSSSCYLSEVFSGYDTRNPTFGDQSRFFVPHIILFKCPLQSKAGSKPLLHTALLHWRTSRLPMWARLLANWTGRPAQFVGWKTLLTSAFFQVNIFLPIVFFLISIFLVVLPFFSQPIETLIGLGIALSGIPVYFVTVNWKNKPTGYRNAICRS